MTIHHSFKSIAGIFLTLLLVSGNSNADLTNLASKPITTEYTSQQVLPNIMFVLDDSTSMNRAYLPDWAKVDIPHLYQNVVFNGVAYNPAVNYSAPTMYDSSGNYDVTTYPRQNSVNTSGWTAVPKDAYGVLSPKTTTSNLVGNAVFYTTVAGEFCDTPLLRNCQTTKDNTYKFEAKLRWCRTAADAIAATNSANGVCQASQIAVAAVNTRNGNNSYTYFRAPSPAGQSNSTFTPTGGSTTITGISVGTKGTTTVVAQILSQPVTNLIDFTTKDLSALLGPVSTYINACTKVAVGNCNVVGYSAIYDGNNTLIIFAPASTANSPAVTPASPNTPQFTISTSNMTVAATPFTSTPGSVIATNVVSTTADYGYACVAGKAPDGTACVKAPNRTDCAGTTCTYAEEMTNYANWYAYYQTRMQMMKTVVSQAFDLKLNDSGEPNFRVGYFTINNGTGNDFLNIGSYTNAYKHTFYDLLFKALPNGETPLRTALSTAGKVYANKVKDNTINTKAVSDPVQYSCQQNYTILSTDGYWNDSSNPTQLDNLTEIGQQDGFEKRPYYDGATIQQTVNQTKQTVDQIATNTNYLTSKTLQQMKSTSNLRQVKAGYYLYPYKVDTKTLQSRTSTLQEKHRNLISTDYKLQKTVNKLKQEIFQPITKTLPVETVLVRPIQSSYSLQARIWTPLSTVYPLQTTISTRYETDTLLKQTVKKVQVYTQVLQIRTVVTTDGNVDDSGWGDVKAPATSCVPSDSGAGSPRTVVTCKYTDTAATQYVDSIESDGSCTPAARAGTSYSPRTLVSCRYADGAITNDLPTCNAGTASATGGKLLPYNTCAYQSPSPAYQLNSANAASCTDSSVGTGPNYAKAVSCTYQVTTPTANAATCVAQTTSDKLTKTECSYSQTKSRGPEKIGSGCKVVNQSGPSYSGDQVICSYGNSADTAFQNTTSQCATASKTSTSFSSTDGKDFAVQKECQYSGTATTGTTSSVDTCTEDYSTSSPYTITTKTGCVYPSTTTIAAQAASKSGVACTASSGTASTSEPSVTTKLDTLTQCRFASTPSEGTSGTAGASCSGNAGNLANGTSQVSCQYPATAQTINYGPTITSCSATTNQTTSTTAVYTNLDAVTKCSYVQASQGYVSTGSCDVATANGYNVGTTTSCDYIPQPANNTATSCAPISAPSTATSYSTYLYRTCSYDTETGYANFTGSTCSVGTPSSGTGTWSGPVTTACTYTGWSLFQDATSCSLVAQNNSNKTAKDCQYSSAQTSYKGTCSPIAESSSYANATAVACTPQSPLYEAVQSSLASDTNVESCTPGSQTTPNTPETGASRRVDTTCTYNAYTTAVAAACATDKPRDGADTNGSVAAGTATTAVTCTLDTNPGIPNGSTVDSNGFVHVNSCTPVGTASPVVTYDGGKNVQCVQTTPTPDAFVAVGTCTPGNSTFGSFPAYLQTNCVLKQHIVTPVLTCSPSTATDFVTTTCQSLSGVPTNVAACTPQDPTFENGYTTISCGSLAGTGTYNTLADVAEYYFKSDLRTSSLGNCTGAQVTAADGTVSSNAVCTTPPDTLNNVPATGADDNKAQHMTTFTLGLGASGFMQYTSKFANSVDNGGSPDYLSIAVDTVAAPASGVCTWQKVAGNCNWPYPLTNDQSGIDDLWHAGLNGRGNYFSATDPTSLTNSISTALNSVNNARGSSTGLATSTANVTKTNNFSYTTSFATGSWDGEVIRQQIDPATGNVTTRIDWTAQAKLDNRSVASRDIYTFDSSSTTKLSKFTVGNFGSDSRFQKSVLANSTSGIDQFTCTQAFPCLPSTAQDAAAGPALVNYLIGDRTNEGDVKENSKYFRLRNHVLGDIVNSPVTYAGPPKSSYADAGYSQFATNNAGRLPLAIVGANDGMLHAFRAQGSATAEAALKATIADPSNDAKKIANIQAQQSDVALGIDAGQERWAYIPSVLLKDLYKLADKNYSSKHRYFVDGSQEVGDICYFQCGTADAAWKTILVGGLAGGGRTYYALDITDPENPKGLWEKTFTNLGYTYGNPQIAKQSDGRWVVLFSSGYNNVTDSSGNGGGDGQGKLFVLDANDGTLLQEVSTGFGSAGSPSGLSKIVAEVVNGDSDATMEAVYGGDMYGNLWRFDINQITVSPSSPLPFKTQPQLMVTFKDAVGTPQPLTSKPAIAIVDTNTVVYVGTGAYLAADDAKTVDTQSFYAVKDTRATTAAGQAIYGNPREGSDFVKQTQTVTTCPYGTSTSICVTGDPVRTSTSTLVDWTTKGGWYFDLPVAGERANTDPSYNFSLLIFNTNVPTTLACNLGGYSFQYQVDYRTGGAASGAVGGLVAFKLGNQLASGVAVYTTGGNGTTNPGTGAGKTGSLLGGGTVNKGTLDNPTPADTRRTSWRELITH